MGQAISEEDIRRAVEKVRHPEIDNTLIELGMIRDITPKDDRVILTMALPFLQIPIKDYLVHSVQEPVRKLGVQVEVKLIEMNQEERETFISMAREGWIG
jgi:metal-sulfur cluster biosynthetic enzyme